MRISGAPSAPLLSEVSRPCLVNAPCVSGNSAAGGSDNRRVAIFRLVRNRHHVLGRAVRVQGRYPAATRGWRRYIQCAPETRNPSHLRPLLFLSGRRNSAHGQRLDPGNHHGFLSVLQNRLIKLQKQRGAIRPMGGNRFAHDVAFKNRSARQNHAAAVAHGFGRFGRKLIAGFVAARIQAIQQFGVESRANT